MKKILSTLVISFSFIAAHSAFAQDHGHLYVGATSTDQGAQLIIINAADFVTTTDYVKTLNDAATGQYAGYFEGNITFEAKSMYDVFGDPVPGSAAPGSWIFAQITSVEGPNGGAFNFWDVGAVTPTYSIPCRTISTNSWFIGNNNGAPDTDPYGHIHGRRFTATKPGIYIVGLRALDGSTNGVGGGPIHDPSDVVKVSFQAGINISSINRTDNVAAVRFGSPLGKTFNLEANTNLATTNWVSVGSVDGNDKFQTLNDTNGSSATFYRIRVTTP